MLQVKSVPEQKTQVFPVLPDPSPGSCLHNCDCMHAQTKTKISETNGGRASGRTGGHSMQTKCLEVSLMLNRCRPGSL